MVEHPGQLEAQAHISGGKDGMPGFPPRPALPLQIWHGSLAFKLLEPWRRGLVKMSTSATSLIKKTRGGNLGSA